MTMPDTMITMTVTTPMLMASLTLAVLIMMTVMKGDACVYRAGGEDDGYEGAMVK